VWVNNAGVGVLGAFEAVPPDVFRGVIETNFFGCVHGARAVLPHFTAQDHGILINLASMLGKMAMPYYTAYAAAKFAVVGFGETLREELIGPVVDVVPIMPAAIDTPFFAHSANYTGRAVKPPRPVYDPDDVARAIVRAAYHPRREIFVGGAARAMSALHAMAPALYEQAARSLADFDHFQDREAGPTPGAVLAPVPSGTDIRGGWRAHSTTRTAPTRAVAIGAAIVLPAYLALRALRRAAAGGSAPEDLANLREDGAAADAEPPEQLLWWTAARNLAHGEPVDRDAGGSDGFHDGVADAALRIVVFHRQGPVVAGARRLQERRRIDGLDAEEVDHPDGHTRLCELVVSGQGLVQRHAGAHDDEAIIVTAAP